MSTTTAQGTRAALVLAALAVLEGIDDEGGEGPGAHLGERIAQLREEVARPPLPALTFEPGDCWETFAHVLANRLGDLVMGATPASQGHADAFFGGSMEPFDIVVKDTDGVDNPVDDIESEYGIVYQRFDEVKGEPIGTRFRAPLSAFANLHLY